MSKLLNGWTAIMARTKHKQHYVDMSGFKIAYEVVGETTKRNN